MNLCFQSLRSGSSGNCLLLRSGQSTVLIDAGFSSMRGCRQALEKVLPGVDALVVSHLHTDHIHYASLRVLEQYRIPVYVCARDLRLLASRCFRQYPFFGLQVRPFDERSFSVGDLCVRPFRVLHDGLRLTFGFEIFHSRRGRERKMVVATDFRDWRGVQERFQDADFIFVEANHSPELLRQHPNPRSHYHLSNEHCGGLLRQAFSRSRTRPGAVMLGHLSEIRNRPAIAAHTVREILGEAGIKDLPLHIAPRYEPSAPVEIA